jgi:uncharacterized membrane protein YcgQ (UPF0703/DUF1980 family)
VEAVIEEEKRKRLLAEVEAAENKKKGKEKEKNKEKPKKAKKKPSAEDLADANLTKLMEKMLQENVALRFDESVKMQWLVYKLKQSPDRNILVFSSWYGHTHTSASVVVLQHLSKGT